MYCKKHCILTPKIAEPSITKNSAAVILIFPWDNCNANVYA